LAHRVCCRESDFPPPSSSSSPPSPTPPTTAPTAAEATSSSSSSAASAPAASTTSPCHAGRTHSSGRAITTDFAQPTGATSDDTANGQQA